MRIIALSLFMVSTAVMAEPEEPAKVDADTETQKVFKQLAEEQMGPRYPSRLCEGDGCDAYLPILKRSARFQDIDARRRWGSTLGGISGALIGNEVADAPGAIIGALVGAAGGYNYIDREQWEEDAKAYDQAWQRGDDIYYNPAHRLPLEAHWMYAGPAAPDIKKKK